MKFGGIYEWMLVLESNDLVFSSASVSSVLAKRLLENEMIIIR